MEYTRRRAFNKRLSGIRIYVEHAFGMLKGRFPSLKELPAFDNMDEAYKVIQAMMVIHNLCIDWGDAPETIPDYVPGDNDDLHPGVWDKLDIDVDLVSYGKMEVHGGDLPAEERSARRLKRRGDRKHEGILNMLYLL